MPYPFDNASRIKCWVSSSKKSTFSCKISKMDGNYKVFNTNNVQIDNEAISNDVGESFAFKLGKNEYLGEEGPTPWVLDMHLRLEGVSCNLDPDTTACAPMGRQ